MSGTVVHFLKYDETRQASNWWGRTGLPQHLAINKNLVGKTTISRLLCCCPDGFDTGFGAGMSCPNDSEAVAFRGLDWLESASWILWLLTSVNYIPQRNANHFGLFFKK